MELNRLYDEFFDFGEVTKPYTNDDEVLKDLFAFLDMAFTLVTGAKGFSAEDFPPREETGAALDFSVSSTDLHDVLLSKRRENRAELSQESKEQLNNALFHIASRTRRGMAQDFVSRYDALAIKFALSEYERFALLLALSVEYDRKYEAVYAYLHNNASDIYPSKWLAAKLYTYLFSEGEGNSELLDSSSPLIRFLCDDISLRTERGDSAHKLTLSPRAVSYILGKNEIDASLCEYCSLYNEFNGEDYVPVRQELQKKINDFFVEKAFRDEKFVINLYGPTGIGRKYSAEIAVKSLGLRLINIDLKNLIVFGYDNIQKLIDKIYVETVLLGAVACFTTDVALVESDNEGGTRRSPLYDKVKRALDYIISVFDFFFWATPEKDDLLTSAKAEFISFEMPMLSANERKQFWDKYLPDSADNTGIANQYILAPSNIKKAAQTAVDMAGVENSDVTFDIISQSVRQHSVNPLGNYATRINAVFSWDDLVISDDQKRKMQMICNQVKYRGKVNEDWGFSQKSPYGRGLCALFYGSPGTGKTMAVQVMANELGLDLYRIDLSQLSSKYIGETQKNIASLFNKAKNINAMLFFDEADSMFAKRSEVKDANDRYANADTAFLLQKLEDYEGITILATNYVNNIDDAFKRRIKFMVNFVFPTPDVRLRLWKKILPECAQTDEEIDFEFFAEHFELSGSNIKEILTNAAYLAAADGTGIKNSHIIEAVKLNFSKYGKVLTDSDFEYLVV